MQVTKAEFRVALPLLGLDAEMSSAIDELFDLLDVECVLHLRCVLLLVPIKCARRWLHASAHMCADAVRACPPVRSHSTAASGLTSPLVSRDVPDSGGGSVEHAEMHARLRQGSDILLRDELRDGAAGVVEVGAHNRVGLREQAPLGLRTGLGTRLDTHGDSATPIAISSVDELREAVCCYHPARVLPDAHTLPDAPIYLPAGTCLPSSFRVR